MKRSSASRLRQSTAAVDPRTPTPQKATRMPVTLRVPATERNLRSQVDAPRRSRRVEAVDHVVVERVVRQVRDLKPAQPSRAHELDRDPTDVAIAQVRIDVERVV